MLLLVLILGRICSMCDTLAPSSPNYSCYMAFFQNKNKKVILSFISVVHHYLKNINEILSAECEILINDQIKISSHLFTWKILVHQKENYFTLIIQLDCCGVMIMTHLCCSFSLKLRLSG